MREREPIDLDAVRWAIRKGRAVLIPDIDVAVCDIDGRAFRFASDRLEDPVQRQNRKGDGLFAHYGPQIAVCSDGLLYLLSARSLFYSIKRVGLRV